MPKFEVDVNEVWFQTYEVEAENEEQARDKVKDDRMYGTGETTETNFGYSHTVEEDDIEKWEVRKLG